MPLTTLQRQDLDATFDAAFSSVKAAQDDFIKTRPRYAQVKQGNLKPSYQDAALPVSIDSDYLVHQYHGRRGAGWMLVADVAIGADTYVKVQQDGPETYFAFDWLEQPKVKP